VSSQERLLKVLLGPIVSEKSARLAEDQQFAFKVVLSATKTEIRDAVESLFDVKVTGVQMLRVKGKTKRSGQRFGRRSDWKKAYVTLAEGQDIDFMGAA